MNGFADEKLISDFVAESREHLDSIEPDLLVMEQEGAGASQEIINRVFRAIHSIKGGAGFLSFERLKRLSHTMESVLMQVRDGKLQVTPALMDALLGGVDKLRAMMDDIQASEQIPCDTEIVRLSAILEGKPLGPVPAPNPVAPPSRKLGVEALTEFDVDFASVRTAVANGRCLFRLQVDVHTNILDNGIALHDFLENVSSCGEHIAQNVDIAELEQRLAADPEFMRGVPLALLYATVLEEDLLAAALNLAEGNIRPFDMAAIKAALKQQKPADDKKAATKGGTGAVTPVATISNAPYQPVGEILINMGADPKMVAAALGKQSSGDSRLIGAILLELGAVTPELLERALSMQKSQKESAPKPKTVKTKAETADTLRVRVDLLSRLMNTASELVLGRNQLLRAMDRHKDGIPGLDAILQNVDRVTSELQEGIMHTRMQSMGTLFGRFPRVVRDMARNLNKDIELEVEGAEVELDKSIIELLSDPLTHIIRNCADHAIESREERQAKGKVPTGKILMRAYHEGGQVNISIADDGRGINSAKVLQKAIEKGLVKPADAEKMKERDIVNLVFAPGFSTAETVTDISGRGVGMDVVRTNIEKLGGHIDVDTAVDRGTTVLLRLPLTLAIIPSLIVGASGQRFAVPQMNLVELVWVRAADIARRIENVHGASVLRLRGRLLPLVRLTDILGIVNTYLADEGGERLPSRRVNIADRRSASEDSPSPDANKADADLENLGKPVERSRGNRRTDWHSDYNILVLQVGSNQFGVIVDDLFDMEEIVVKPLSTFIKNCHCFAGATISGDGKVMMILDAGGLAETAALRFSDMEAEERRRDEEKRQNVSERRSVILFNNAAEEFFAVPQDKVLRLERIKLSEIQRAGNREFIQYRGAGLMLVRLDEYLPVQPLPDSESDLFLIIPKDAGQTEASGVPAGILVSNIVDALDVNVTVQECAMEGPGLIGGAIVNGKLTIFVEPTELLRTVCGAQEHVA